MLLLLRPPPEEGHELIQLFHYDLEVALEYWMQFGYAASVSVVMIHLYVGREKNYYKRYKLVS